MSGTSVDAIDAALVQVDDSGAALLNTHQHVIPAAVREQVAAISHQGPDEIERLGRLDRELGTLFAEATCALLTSAGREAGEIRAIGSHGQTIRHRPPSGGNVGDQAFTLQIADPNTIAEQAGITTVADFRRRDVAAGGEGAPLAPAFHSTAFSRKGVNRAVVNIGGIANVSLLQGQTLRAGFDTGPGNTLLDQWIARHRGKTYDRNGLWSAGGTVNNGLLNRLLNHPYFDKRGPRSTGREDFNLSWLDHALSGGESPAPQDVQATLAELTATGILQGIESTDLAIEEVYVCGGGAHNTDLMARMQRLLGSRLVATTENLGMHPDWVEAATFAWLAHQTLEGLAGNAPVVTGASGARVLGGIYPA
jgi:anhydro-N-acetylmuramic acid kinase